MSATKYGTTVTTKPQPKQKSRKQIFLRIRKDDDQVDTELRKSIQVQQRHNNINNNNNRDHCVESKSELPLTIQSSEAHELNEVDNINKSYKITIASSGEEANLAATRGGPILKNTLPAENLARQLAQVVKRPQLSAEELVLSWRCETIPSPVEDVVNFERRFERHEADIEQRGYFPEASFSSHSKPSSHVSVVSQRSSARLAKQIEYQKQQQQRRCRNTLDINNFKEFEMRMQKEFRRQPTINEIPNLSERLAERYNYEKPTTSAAACLAVEKRSSAEQMVVDREKMLPPRKRKQIMDSSAESESHNINKIGNGYRQMPKRKVNAQQRTPVAAVQNAEIISSSHVPIKLIVPPIKPTIPPKAKTSSKAKTTPKNSNANNCKDVPNNLILKTSEKVEEKRTCNPLIVLRQDFSTKNLQLGEKRAQIFSNDVNGNINKLPPTILLPPMPPEAKTDLSPKNTNSKKGQTSDVSTTTFNHGQHIFCNSLGLTVHETVKACKVASVELAKIPTQRRSLRVRKQEQQKLQTQLTIPPFRKTSTNSNNSNQPALTKQQKTLADLKSCLENATRNPLINPVTNLRNDKYYNKFNNNNNNNNINQYNHYNKIGGAAVRRNSIHEKDQPVIRILHRFSSVCREREPEPASNIFVVPKLKTVHELRAMSNMPCLKSTSRLPPNNSLNKSVAKRSATVLEEITQTTEPLQNDITEGSIENIVENGMTEENSTAEVEVEKETEDPANPTIVGIKEDKESIEKAENVEAEIMNNLQAQPAVEENMPVDVTRNAAIEVDVDAENVVVVPEIETETSPCIPAAETEENQQIGDTDPIKVIELIDDGPNAAKSNEGKDEQSPKININNFDETKCSPIHSTQIEIQPENNVEEESSTMSLEKHEVIILSETENSPAKIELSNNDNINMHFEMENETVLQPSKSPSPPPPSQTVIAVEEDNLENNVGTDISMDYNMSVERIEEAVGGIKNVTDIIETMIINDTNGQEVFVDKNGTQVTEYVQNKITYFARSTPPRNPLNSEYGPVLHIYFELDVLIVVQELSISFWKYSKLMNVLSMYSDHLAENHNGDNEFMLLDRAKRLTNDTEITAGYGKHLCISNSLPVYMEMRGRFRPPEFGRQCPLLGLYVNVYYYHDEDMICKMHSAQLDTVQSLAEEVTFTTIPDSRYFIMCWSQMGPTRKRKTGMVKYSLSPQLDSLASIREFKDMRYHVKLLDCVNDDMLLGFGDTQLTIWDHRSGDVLMNFDFQINLGRNIASIYYPSAELEQNNMMLLFQYMSGITNDPLSESSQHELMLLVCSVSHVSPTYRILKRFCLPQPAFSAGLLRAENNGEHLILTARHTDEELWISCTDPNAMFLLSAQHSDRFYVRGRTQIIELTEHTLTVDNVANHLLKMNAADTSINGVTKT